MLSKNILLKILIILEAYKLNSEKEEEIEGLKNTKKEKEQR